MYIMFNGLRSTYIMATMTFYILVSTINLKSTFRSYNEVSLGQPARVNSLEIALP